ncbi:Hypothetical predicted protein, partial [Olea europaea subsp. europaea]
SVVVGYRRLGGEQAVSAMVLSLGIETADDGIVVVSDGVWIEIGGGRGRLLGLF